MKIFKVALNDKTLLRLKNNAIAAQKNANSRERLIYELLVSIIECCEINTAKFTEAGTNFSTKNDSIGRRRYIPTIIYLTFTSPTNEYYFYFNGYQCGCTIRHFDNNSLEQI